MTLLVRDEEDIVAANIDFHLEQGVDTVIVTDNLSEDATTEILAEYARNRPVHVLQASDDDYRQSVWVTQMARMAYCEFGADWVINADADEFWWTDSHDLRDVLSRVEPGCDAIEVDRWNFPPARREDGAFFDRMIVRDLLSRNSLGRPLPPKVCHRGRPDVVVAQGNHRVRLEGSGPLTPGQAPMEILHFPLRTYRQFETKIRNGGAAYRRSQHPDKVGATWRHLYEECLAGRLPSYYSSEIVELSDLPISGGRFVEDRRLRDFMVERRLTR